MLDFDTFLWLTGIGIPAIAYVRNRGSKLFKLLRDAFKDGHLSKQEFEDIVDESGRIVRFLFKTYSEVDDKL